MSSQEESLSRCEQAEDEEFQAQVARKDEITRVEIEDWYGYAQGTVSGKHVHASMRVSAYLERLA